MYGKLVFSSFSALTCFPLISNMTILRKTRQKKTIFPTIWIMKNIYSSVAKCDRHIYVGVHSRWPFNPEQKQKNWNHKHMVKFLHCFAYLAVEKKCFRFLYKIRHPTVRGEMRKQLDSAQLSFSSPFSQRERGGKRMLFVLYTKTINSCCESVTKRKSTYNQNSIKNKNYRCFRI